MTFTVKDLIAQLQEMPQDAQIKLFVWDEDRCEWTKSIMDTNAEIDATDETEICIYQY